MSANFVFYNFGFFLYMIERAECARLVVPRTEAVRHWNVLWVPASDTEIDSFLPIIPLGEYVGINMEGLSISINNPKPANLGRRQEFGKMSQPDFDWIPDISRTWCGLKLNPHWRRSPAVESVIGLSGGVIRAMPDKHTCERVWSWTHCDGTIYAGQRVTALTTYEPETSDLTLAVHNTATEAHVAQIKMKTDPARPAFHFNLPEATFRDEVPARDEVESSHIQAIMRLGVRSGSELRVPQRIPLDCPCDSNFEPAARLDRSLRMFDLFLKLLPMHEGTIECSGGSIPNP